jgi:hypothetical protein
MEIAAGDDLLRPSPGGRRRSRRPRACVPITYRRSERKRFKGGRRTAGGRRESCDELSTRMQRNHRLARHPEDGSAYPQRLLAHACADAACANQPSIRLVATEQEGSDIRSRPFGVRPSYDDELGAVEAAQDGIVGDQNWAVSLHAASATLETAVGLKVRGRLIRRCEPGLKQVRGRRL